MKVWITKYALTKGILTIDGVLAGDGLFRPYGEWTSFYYGEGKDWHRTPESAIARAEEMRKNKIASLHKSIKKLESMKFTADEETK